MKSLIDIFNDIIVENLNLANQNISLNEKLKLNANSELQETPKSKSTVSTGTRDLSSIRTPANLTGFFNKMTESKLAGHVKKMQAYHDKGSTPKTLVNTIKHPDKLVIRFTIGVLMGWYGCIDTFRQAIIDRNIASDDAIDKFILSIYQDRSLSYTYGAGFPQSMQKSLKPNIEKYLNKYNIKY